ncbi:MAG: hypothetical protein F6K50_38340 [Moorea sp. SIO3I7]|uniref:hypothetical protein n=1 Tax=unclassified Moorena TaxID=2683338 RepID=UPI0013C80411|nr:MULTISPECIES: hypothetical protein [unclassified Moorena]NEO01069.1 hypothetical protein [Moorena sp. SIO3I7]NEO12392.1 hypothetical protein [Moorena sp. SIO3E8]NEO45710.1 hypothetical protein [Moorena sp. SIO4A3]NEP97549.1 hypothetical protein [Moorena sp. SIO3F7]
MKARSLFTTQIKTLYHNYSRRAQDFFPTPCSLFPTPYSLLPTPYSLLPIPYSLFPVPFKT